VQGAYARRHVGLEGPGQRLLERLILRRTARSFARDVRTDALGALRWNPPSSAALVSMARSGGPVGASVAMSSVFVSYRRTDAPGHAGRIYDRLVERLGVENVFRDLESIEPGADFPKLIESTVARCAVLLAILGPNWLTAEADGVQRLSSPDDWVRLEIATALRRDIRVVPILVQGASMPAVADLPDDLKPLVRRNAVELTEKAWGLQLSQLIESLGETASASWSATLVERTWMRDVFKIALSHDIHLLEYRCGSTTDKFIVDGRTLTKAEKGTDVARLRFQLTDGPSTVDVECGIRTRSLRFFPYHWTIRAADITLFDGKAKL
jgi:hypothetical protein